MNHAGRHLTEAAREFITETIEILIHLAPITLALTMVAGVLIGPAQAGLEGRPDQRQLLTVTIDQVQCR